MKAIAGQIRCSFDFLKKRQPYEVIRSMTQGLKDKCVQGVTVQALCASILKNYLLFLSLSSLGISGNCDRVPNKIGRVCSLFFKFVQLRIKKQHSTGLLTKGLAISVEVKSDHAFIILEQALKSSHIFLCSSFCSKITE